MPSGAESNSDWWRAGQKPYATQSGKASRKWRESVNPGSMNGTTSPSGSLSATQSTM